MLTWNTSQQHTVDMGHVDIISCLYDYNDREHTFLQLLLCIPRSGRVECTIRYGVGLEVYSEFRTQVNHTDVSELTRELFNEADRTSLNWLTSTLAISISR